MKFYCYKQNCPQELLIKNEDVDEYVIIEAEDQWEANIKAGLAGIYFDGSKFGIDDKEIGDRWNLVLDEDSFPTIEESLSHIDKGSIIIYFSNGKKISRKV